MLSVANVRSASAAADYFAKDNYYAKADADRSGQWIGSGADVLGLKGRVEPADFNAVLQGELPNGERIGNGGKQHRAGTDLTFSMPKSWSLLALVAGDKRIVEAYRQAVIDTLKWAENNLSETRVQQKDGSIAAHRTGNLTIGLFQHDTNRNSEPNVHFHAVVANATRSADGKWRAIHNDKLWSSNTLLNSIAMARFRIGVEALGYQTGPVQKHGNFEARGVSREIIIAFSTRRQEVLEARKGTGLEAGKIAALETRKGKSGLEDRAQLQERWQREAERFKLTFASVVSRAHRREMQSHLVPEGLKDAIDQAKRWVQDFARVLGREPDDDRSIPYLLSDDKADVAAAAAVQSALRHLGEREAAFPRHALFKAALDFGLPTTIERIEAYVSALEGDKALLSGKGEFKDWVTTKESVALERSIIDGVAAGQGLGPELMDKKEAHQRIAAAAAVTFGFRLNHGQTEAATRILVSRDRTIAIQGIAGAGKSSLLQPTAQILREEGKTVLGLAVQNTLAQMLKRETGIEAMTLSRFLQSHAKVLQNPDDLTCRAEARAALKDHVLVLDEASMVSNIEKDQLVRLANLAGLPRLVLLGDKRQLGAVNAGKPFDLVQRAGIDRAILNLNIRARNPDLKRAQHAAQSGQVREAMAILKDHIIETNGDDSAVLAAETWLKLSPEERERTSIYASGRALRGAVNEAVQAGLRASGELGQESRQISVLVRVNATREELRYASSYQKDMIIEARSHEKALGLKRGQYQVLNVDHDNRRLLVADASGKHQMVRPAALRAHGKDSLALLEPKKLDLHTGDRIRWTANDHKRGLYNADQAKVEKIEGDTISFVTSSGAQLSMDLKDPMLKRIDLAYALNAHMAQGLTSDKGIAVMDSRERNLSNQKTFLVTITRLRDHLTLIVDNKERFADRASAQTGEKASSLDTVHRLKQAAQEGQQKAAEQARDREAGQMTEQAKEKSRRHDFGL